MTDAYTYGITFESDELNDAVSQLEERSITISDLITLEAIELAKRTGLPVSIIGQLRERTVRQLHEHIKASKPPQDPAAPLSISTLDAELDDLLGGGFRPGHVQEIVGPSGAGKTQWLFTTLLTAQLEPPHGLSRPSLYISTEHPLPTQRLSELIAHNPILQAASPKPSLGKILTLNATDLEVQDHILNFQLPVVLERHKIGVVVIDSIAANYRGDALRQDGNRNQGKALSDRSADLIKLGSLLRTLAQKHNCAIICANQVADRIDSVSGPGTEQSQPFQSSPAQIPGSSTFQSTSSPQGRDSNGQEMNRIPESVLSLDHQQRWFTGWGDSQPGRDAGRMATGATAKVPALGMIWSNQISCRVALYKSTESASKRAHIQNGGSDRTSESRELSGADWAPRRFRRWARLVFAPWVQATEEDDPGIEFEVWAGGLRSIGAIGANELS